MIIAGNSWIRWRGNGQSLNTLSLSVCTERAVPGCHRRRSVGRTTYLPVGVRDRPLRFRSRLCAGLVAWAVCRYRQEREGGGRTAVCGCGITLDRRMVGGGAVRRCCCLPEASRVEPSCVDYRPEPALGRQRLSASAGTCQPRGAPVTPLRPALRTAPG